MRQKWVLLLAVVAEREHRGRGVEQGKTGVWSEEKALA